VVAKAASISGPVGSGAVYRSVGETWECREVWGWCPELYVVLIDRYDGMWHYQQQKEGELEDRG